MNIRSYRNVYFLGIGGIGMSALARYFRAQGLHVSGYDKTPGELTDALQAEGIQVFFDEALSALPEFVTSAPEQTLLIYTPAIPATHPQLRFLQNDGYRLYKRSEVLGLISKDSYCIAVAGTHGKTTTSTMIAWLLEAAGINFTAFLGGISANFHSNYIHKTNGKNLFPDKPVVVLEADEFDRSFHRLSPDIAVITAIDPDHLDIYETEAAFYEAFLEFSRKIKPSGSLLVHKTLEHRWPKDRKVFRYGLEQGDAASDFSSRFTEITHGNFYFNYRGRYQGVEILENQMYCGLPGYHNIENATAALGVTCNILNLDAASLRQGLSDFRGVKRRFEYLIKQHDAVVIDDYAHHPEELRAILSSVRALYPDKKLTAIFQPHLFTRTRDFASGFAEVLAMPDELILMDIYPARELPIPGISSQWLLEQIAHDHKSLLSPQAITTKVKSEKPELLLLLGAGDIDRLSNPIKQIYEAD